MAILCFKGVFPNKIGLFAYNQTFCPPKFLAPPKILGWLRHCLDIRCLWMWRHHYDVIFRFATNVLGTFVDTTCIFKDAGAAVGQRDQ